MKNYFFALFIGLMCITAYIIVNRRSHAHASGKRIAILTPTTHPALEEIEQGFKETLQSHGLEHYTFETFNANGNRTLLYAQAEEVVNGTYDLIFTIAAAPSHCVAELLKKKHVTTPHIFSAIDGRTFAQTLSSINNSSTGVYLEPEYEKEIALLHALKPTIKNALLIYDPTQGTGLEKYKLEIEHHLKQYGIHLQSVEIYQANEIQQKVAALLSGIDVVLVLIDNTVVSAIDSLITLCNRHNITLCASDLASGKKGAAFAYGITEYDSGSKAAEKALALLNGKKPQELSIEPILNFRLAINPLTKKQQNIDISDATVKRVLYEQGVSHD